MPIYRVTHSGMMGDTISEEFFDSKNKAKRALRKKFKELKPQMASVGDSVNLSEPVVHCKQIHFDKKSEKSFELLFEVWHKCSYEYDEWDLYVEGLHIDLIQVN